MTGEWLASSKQEVLSDGSKLRKGSYVLEHGLLAGIMTAGGLNSLMHHNTFLKKQGFNSIGAYNKFLSLKLGLDYQNHMELPDLDLQYIKKMLLEYRLEHEEWLPGTKRAAGVNGMDGEIGSYLLEVSEDGTKMPVGSIESALSKVGLRGIKEASSIATLNNEISWSHSLDYINVRTKKNVTIDGARQSICLHRLKTGQWLSKSTQKIDKNGNKKAYGTYVMTEGACARQFTAAGLQTALRTSNHGFENKSSIAQEVEYIAAQFGVIEGTSFEIKKQLGLIFDVYYDMMLQDFSRDKEALDNYLEDFSFEDLVHNIKKHHDQLQTDIAEAQLKLSAQAPAI